MRRALTLTAMLALGTTPVLAQQPVSKDAHAGHAAAPAGAWQSLTSLDAWRSYKAPAVQGDWKQVDATTFEKMKGTTDLVTRQQYTNFELELDWKLSPGGNAGLFYHATEDGDKVYWTGPEYQLLDNARHPDGKNPLTSTGSAYGLYAPPEGIAKEAGEWNTTRIVIKGAHVEHYLNGKKSAEYDLWSPEWEAKVKASKFSAWPGYGRSKRGYVGIQGDHTGTLTVRNARIRELP